MTITTIEDLKEFILQNDLSEQDIALLLKSTLNVFVSGTYDKKVLAELVVAFYEKYPSNSERPLFLAVEDGKITVEDFGYRPTRH